MPLPKGNSPTKQPLRHYRPGYAPLPPAFHRHTQNPDIHNHSDFIIKRRKQHSHTVVAEKSNHLARIQWRLKALDSEREILEKLARLLHILHRQS